VFFIILTASSKKEKWQRGQMKSGGYIGVKLAESDCLGSFAHGPALNRQKLNACTLPFAAMTISTP